MSAGNYQKTPIGLSLGRIAREAVATALQQTGKALPCTVVAVSGQFVTVNFEIAPGPFTLENVTIPIATSAYDWLPIQKGDIGTTVAADVDLAPITTGSGIASLVQQPNLTALVFQPLPKKSATVPNVNQRVVHGPAGVLLQDTGANCTFDLTTTDIAGVAATTVSFKAGTSVTLICGANSITLSSAGVVIDSLNVVITTLPTAAGGIGQLWNHSGTVMVS